MSKRDRKVEKFINDSIVCRDEFYEGNKIV